MVYNVDDPYSDFMREGFKGEQISFGIQNAADYHGRIWHSTAARPPSA